MKMYVYKIWMGMIALGAFLSMHGNACAQNCALFWKSAGLDAADTAQYSGKNAGYEAFEKLSIRSQNIVATDGTRRVCIRKDSLYGYRLRNQKCYRWDAARQCAYEIVERKHVIIYRVSEPQYTSKGYVLRPVIYFSRGLDSKIWPLTPTDVKRAFPEAHALHVQLDLLADAECICQIDPVTHSYKIQQWIEKYTLQSCNNSQQ